MPLVRRLGLLAVLLAVAGSWSGVALAASAPVVVTPPAIDGRPQVGTTQFATTGDWTNAPTTYAFQWERCDGTVTVCTAIPGATASFYTPAGADAGYLLHVVVTATNAGGSGTARSAPTFTIAGATLQTDHFAIHYSSDPLADPEAAITQTTAGDIGARAERAYAAELGAGYPAPLSDGALGGDSRIDVYVGDLQTALTGALAVTVPDDETASRTAAWIVLDGQNGLSPQTVAHEVFHAVQLGIWLPAAVADYWLLEGSAEWMGYRVTAFDPGTVGFDLGNWDMSLDCRDPLGTSKCDLVDGYKNGGYSRWPFFEYLAERYGAGFVKTVFDQGAAGAASATSALSAAIAAKGGSLADVFTDWTVATMTGGFDVQALKSQPPPPPFATIPTGTLASANARTPKGNPLVTTADLAPTTLAVNHLSVRYVAIERGDPDLKDTPCYAATLRLTVSLPAVGARPYFWWSQKNKDGTNAQQAQALSVDGSTASISVPWDTCEWGATTGYLSLPNPSTAVDSADFTIRGTLSIDRSTQATPTPPPDPVSVHGTTVDAGTAAAAPRIEVFGPQLIHVSAGSRQLRLIVSSSDVGSLRAALGSLALGAASLRPGGNDVRFTLPASALGGARATSAASQALTLTPVSTSGAVGPSVVRHVTIDRAKPKPARRRARSHR